MSLTLLVLKFYLILRIEIKAGVSVVRLIGMYTILNPGSNDSIL